MSRDVDIVRRLFEANRSGPVEETTEVAVALTHPDMEFTSRLTSVEGTVYRGHKGVSQYFADMADAWQEWKNDVESLEDLAPGVVLAEATFRATGRSGVAVELWSAILFTLSDERAVGIHSYETRDEALKAAGIS